MKGSVFTKAILGVFICSLFFIPSSGHAQQKVITLKVTHHFPVGHAQSVLFDQWGKELGKRTNGRVKVNVYAGSVLAPSPQIYDAVTKGIADVGNHVLGYTVGRFPFLEGIDLPHGYPSGAAATKMANAFYAKFKPKEMEGVRVLWFHSQAPGILHTKSKPVAKLEDLKGMKIRTFGTNAKLMSNLGGTPIAMPMPDVYDALAKGVVEGLLACYEVMDGHALADQIKYSTENYGSSYTALFLVCMNKKKWEAIPSDIQAIIDQMSVEYVEKFAKMWDEIDKAGKDLLIKRGNKIITLSAEEQARWAEKAKPLIEDYIKNMKAKGLPGEEAIKFINDYLKPYKS
jgi:TRAP-type C4-dicarboxylate transport system substrate-binding protein